MESTAHQRLYNIRNNNVPFYTGLLGDGTQMLIGIQLPEVVAVKFDAEGNCAETAIRESDEVKIENDLNGWHAELGFIPNMISLKKFFLEERWIGIKDIPDYYQEVIDRPEDFDQERRQMLQEDIRQWLENGDFVFYWDEDYYFNRDGQMASS